ncbi:MAG: hypothetical protein NXY59_08205 [Aigarchaeota archaeon]|nr:hypothetical protein [Candidatus Pelearchaeum maunauluense]
MLKRLSLAEKLRSFLESGKDWERRKTSLSGVFLLKIPRKGSRPAEIAVELNPVDSSGQTKKRRGLILRSLDDLNDYRAIINDAKLEQLMKTIEQVNPRGERGEGEEPLEI